MYELPYSKGSVEAGPRRRVAAGIKIVKFTTFFKNYNSLFTKRSPQGNRFSTIFLNRALSTARSREVTGNRGGRGSELNFGIKFEI